MKKDRKIVTIGYNAVITMAVETFEPDERAYNKNKPPRRAANPVNIPKVIPEILVCNLNPIINKIITPKITAPITS